ncbi:MAG: hypothetical protein LBT62_00925 [Deltaproteobacteria bacterium]|jgi:chromosome segregation ATPase|nr:hypothetical protein [Deltaproteobacteria bacterium]
MSKELNNPMDFSKFDLLEKKIETIIAKKDQAQEQIKTLSLELADTKTELDQFKNKLDQAKKEIGTLTEDRKTILQKLDSLLSRLEQI